MCCDINRYSCIGQTLQRPLSLQRLCTKPFRFVNVILFELTFTTFALSFVLSFILNKGFHSDVIFLVVFYKGCYLEEIFHLPFVICFVIWRCHFGILPFWISPNAKSAFDASLILIDNCSNDS